MDISYQPTKQETFKYKVKVSRDNYKWYDEKYVYWAKSQELTITIGRTIDIRDNFNAWLTWEIYKYKTDKSTTKYNWNALWNWLWYKSKEQWEKLISSYDTLWQLERDFSL